MRFQLRTLWGLFCLSAVQMGVAARLDFDAMEMLLSTVVFLPYYALAAALVVDYLDG